MKIFVTGTVQGVFFRNFIKEQAESLELKGFARNLEDGRVEIVLEGKDENVNQMIEKAKQGPPQSEITDIQIEELNHQGFDSFKVLSG